MSINSIEGDSSPKKLPKDEQTPKNSQLMRTFSRKSSKNDLEKEIAEIYGSSFFARKLSIKKSK